MAYLPSGLPPPDAIRRLCRHKVMILLVQVKFVQAYGLAI